MVHTFKRNIVLGLGISLAALIMSSAASYISIQKLLDSDYWVDHTFKVIQNFDYILSRMKDVETAQRGYLLSGEGVFLEPYTGARKDIDDHLDSVELLTADNAAQQKDLPRLSQLIDQKYALVNKTIADKKGGLPVATRSLMDGKALMDQIRKQVSTMEQREQRLMIARTMKMNTFVTYTPLLIVFASLIAVVVTFAFYRRMKNNLEDNRLLQLRLEKREEETTKHIQVITELAEKISKGSYDIRIDEKDPG